MLKDGVISSNTTTADSHTINNSKVRKTVISSTAAY